MVMIHADDGDLEKLGTAEGLTKKKAKRLKAKDFMDGIGIWLEPKLQHGIRVGNPGLQRRFPY